MDLDDFGTQKKIKVSLYVNQGLDDYMLNEMLRSSIEEDFIDVVEKNYPGTKIEGDIFINRTGKMRETNKRRLEVIEVWAYEESKAK